jgi:hypothetical protein
MSERDIKTLGFTDEQFICKKFKNAVINISRTIIDCNNIKLTIEEQLYNPQIIYEAIVPRMISLRAMYGSEYFYTMDILRNAKYSIRETRKRLILTCEYNNFGIFNKFFIVFTRVN